MLCLWVQRETLLRQLETNQLDMDATLEELSVQQETEDQNYEMYSLSFFLSASSVIVVFLDKNKIKFVYSIFLKI